MTLRIGLCQINPVPGGIEENARRIGEAAKEAAEQGANLALFPELSLPGYPPMDLLNRAGFIQDQLQALESLARFTENRIPMVVGAAMPRGSGLQNAAVMLAGGKIHAVRAKTHLPAYDVFDEKRYFTPAEKAQPVRWNGHVLGLTVCEDGWADELGHARNPAKELAAEGAEIILNLSASPWQPGKTEKRREIFAKLATACGRPLFMVNQAGGNDELIFDGGSSAFNAKGELTAALPAFGTATAVQSPAADAITAPAAAPAIQQLESALVLGIRDYFQKQQLKPKAVIGLSGGIDSAVAAHLTALALGPENVLGLAMPGRFSSTHSIEDALVLGRNLKIEVRTVSIDGPYQQFRSLFGKLFGPQDDYGLTQQNIQARLRGNLLMAASNHEDRLVIATGNKSELSMGYCTLYGDMAGGLAVLGDVLKRDVYALARHANRDGPRIPENTIAKPPSAELAPDQKDEDELPPYPVLDGVLHRTIELGMTPEEAALAMGIPEHEARDIQRRVDRNEYKRRQAPPVLRVSPKAFGQGRRMPITNYYIFLG